MQRGLKGKNAPRYWSIACRLTVLCDNLFDSLPVNELADEPSPAGLRRRESPLYVGSS